jgi:hypothetical protein
MLDIDIIDCMTAPSLATFTDKYMDCQDIPILKGPCEQAIRKSYRGGIVNVYKPQVEDGYYYDVNSMYPSVMIHDMPVGKPLYVINPDLDQFFGFIHADIETPPNQLIPFKTSAVDWLIQMGVLRDGFFQRN